MTGPDDNDSREDRIDRKLERIVEALPAKPSWYKVWQALGPESTDEERLTVYRAVRDSGLLPDEAGFFLVSLQIDEIATRDEAECLRDYEERLKEIEQAYRFNDGEVWSPKTAPEDYQEVQREYYRAWDELFANKLEEFGETEMARLFQTNPNRFERLTEAGRRFFHDGSDAESDTPFLWVKQVVEAVAEHMTADSPMGPLGYRYGQDEGFWEIDVYATPVELIGGAVDGEVVVPGFSLDLEGLRAAFEVITDFGWQSLGFSQTEGPRVWIEGTFRGKELLLQVLAYAPEDEEPGMKLNVFRR